MSKRQSETVEVSITGYTLQGAWVVTTDYFVDDAVTDTGETYVCIQDHTASATDRPGVGANWEDYWVLLDFIESSIFRFYPYKNGLLHMPSAWTAADIGFLVSPTVAGVYLPLYNVLGNLIVISGPLADRAYSLPTELDGLFVKLWSNTVSVNEAQGGDRDFLIDLKS